MLTSLRRGWRAFSERRTRGRANLKLQVELEKAAREERKAARKKASEELADATPSLSEEAKDAARAIFKIVVWGAILFGCLFWFWPKEWYGIRYNVTDEHVFIDHKPHDCDFLKAPIGDKGCHFEKVVVVAPENSSSPTDVYVTWQ